MTKRQAKSFVRSCGENEGPDTYKKAAKIFTALYGRTPDQADGDLSMVWSLCCAAV